MYFPDTGAYLSIVCPTGYGPIKSTFLQLIPGILSDVNRTRERIEEIRHDSLSALDLLRHRS